MQYLLMLIQHKREPEEHSELRDVVIASATKKHQEEVKTMAITAEQAFEEKGRIDKVQEIVLRQLAKRFGEVPPALQDRIRRLPEQPLSDLAIDVMDFASIADAERWIGARSSN
jgi:hypothetical protein